MSCQSRQRKSFVGEKKTIKIERRVLVKNRQQTLKLQLNL